MVWHRTPLISRARRRGLVARFRRVTGGSGDAGVRPGLSSQVGATDDWAEDEREHHLTALRQLTGDLSERIAALERRIMALEASSRGE